MEAQTWACRNTCQGGMSMIIYDELLERVREGETFSINLEKRNLRVGNKWLVKSGAIADGDVIANIQYAPETMLLYIEYLYDKYKHSMPSERSESKRRLYFKALPVDKMSVIEMAVGEPREYARARLEGFILCSILMGYLEWNEDWGNWFYQSATDPDLVILRTWIEGGK